MFIMTFEGFSITYMLWTVKCKKIKILYSLSTLSAGLWMGEI